MSAGNNWLDGLHLADVAAGAVVEFMQGPMGLPDATAERVPDHPAQNGPVGAVRITADGAKWILTVVEA